MEDSKNIKSTLKFNRYIIDTLEFKANKNFSGGGVNIDFDISPVISYRENTATVELKINIFKDAEENNYPFSLNMIIVGFFEVNNVEDVKEKILVERNSIAILFPYVRALVTTITANSNVSPLILPPINVVELLKGKNK